MYKGDAWRARALAPKPARPLKACFEEEESPPRGLGGLEMEESGPQLLAAIDMEDGTSDADSDDSDNSQNISGPSEDILGGLTHA